MGDRNAQCLIALHQRESGAWNLQSRIVGNGPYDRAGERRFPGSQIAGKRDEVALCRARAKSSPKRCVAASSGRK